MSWKCTINGVDKTNFVMITPNPHVSLKMNERSTATLMLAPGYVPNKRQEIILYDVDGTTAVFGGVILERTTMAIPEPGAVLFTTSLVCTDWLTYTDWCFWTKTYTVPKTVKQILTDLVSEVLGAYGITLDAGQDNGDTILPFSLDRVKVSDFLRTLATQCSPTRVIRVTPAKALSVKVPGTVSSPFAVSNASPHCLSFEWKDGTFTPATRVVLTCGPSNAYAWIEDVSITANGVASSWTLDVVDLGPFTTDGGGGTIHVGGVIKNMAVGEFTYTYDAVNATATLTLTAGAPGAGTVIDFKRNIQPPFTVIADSGASPRIDVLMTAPDITNTAGGKAATVGLLAQLNQDPREAQLVTFETGLSPAQLMAVTLSSRNLSAVNFTVAQVEADFTEYQQSGVRLWIFNVSMQESTVYQGSYLDQMRTIISGGSSGAAGVVSTGTTTGTNKAIYPLGGSPTVWVQSPTPTWVPADGSPSGDSGTEYVINTVERGSTSGTVRCRLRAAAGSVTARLWDLDAGVQVGISSAYTGTTFNTLIFTVALTAGANRYQLQLLPSLANTDVNGVAYLE